MGVFGRNRKSGDTVKKYLRSFLSYDCPTGQVMSYDTLRVVMSYDTLPVVMSCELRYHFIKVQNTTRTAKNKKLNSVNFSIYLKVCPG